MSCIQLRVCASIISGVLSYCLLICNDCLFFFFQAEDGIRDLVRSRGLGDVYKRQTSVEVQQTEVEVMQ